MLTAIRNSWALLFGMFLLMVGNGLQGTVLGVRGEAEGYSGLTLGLVMSAYFIGFLGGTQATPHLLRRVGHVRVFAALASLVSAAFILFAALVDPIAWFLLRVLVGFCFSGVYVVAESWLNDGATNETRGQTMSAYVTAQMLGIVVAQGLLNVADPGQYELFVIMSVLVSVSFAPILLSSSPVPMFEATRRMSVKRLIEASPLGCVGMFLLGGVFAAQFGMAAVYGTAAGLSVAQISTFVSTFFIGAVLLQYPIGWTSDRMDRRTLILAVSALGLAGSLIGLILGGAFGFLLVSAFVVGGMSNPLYSLLIAHTNDFLEHEDMAAASGGLIFINGLGAVAGPVIVGALMEQVGPGGFYMFTAVLFATLVAYAAYRMTQRATIAVEETGAYVPMAQAAITPVAMEIAQEYAIEVDLEAENPADAA